jgi:putative transposase
VLLRAYLGVVNALALLRLLPMSDRDKDAESWHLHGEKIRFTAADRAFLAALLHQLPKDVLRRIRLLVRPETVLRLHPNLIVCRSEIRRCCLDRCGAARRPAGTLSR